MKNQEHRKLEQFVQNNREDFDNYEVPAGLWDKIDKSLGKEIAPNEDADEVIFKFKKSSISKLKVWAMAASVILLIGCFLTFYLKNNTDSTEQIVAEVAPQYGDKMVQYASMIETKREEIREIETQNPAMYKEFATEIEKLNQDYQNLQAELTQTPNQGELVEAMIQNLQVQLDILNRQLIIIQKVKEYQKNPTKSV
jgi:septal ring factor EnvC (AmiA/AmiB activator)